MGVRAELRRLTGERVRVLPDPHGGSFDAAGDFDRLLVRRRVATPLLDTVDPHGETCLGADRMEQLTAEIELLLAEAAPGPEYRGLIRLRTMAGHCARTGSELVFLGD
ncbi:hypothetical protein AB0F81_16405 [Actinoplanes sp. NPDC024001]|uniref:hypothetical protein n=1 Tax=Actinoplanes sp. NPDC024001 TaxID=3154598 RepID=UPI0033FCE372